LFVIDGEGVIRWSERKTDLRDNYRARGNRTSKTVPCPLHDSTDIVPLA